METKTYTYGDSSWADLLTKYNGKAITYDGIGNMLTYNGATYTWMGRELRKIASGSNTYSYKYNADGIRSSKTVNGTTTEYFLNGSQILALKVGDGVMRFFYDSIGKRVGFANGTMLFYYLYNLQGDVIAIVRATTGQVVAKYTYDAWGNCTVTNAAGQLGRHWDFTNGRGYIYSYDALGRPTRVDCTDGNWLQYGYNTVDQSTFLRYHFDGVTRTTSYTLSADCLSFLIKSG